MLGLQKVEKKSRSTVRLVSIVADPTKDFILFVIQHPSQFCQPLIYFKSESFTHFDRQTLLSIFFVCEILLCRSANRISKSPQSTVR